MKREQSVGRVVNILAHRIKRRADHELGGTMTGVQGRILHFILDNCAEREIFQRDIEEEFHLRCSTATGTLQLMERNGLIRREPVDYDARLKRIVVTEEGIRFKQEIARTLQSIEDMLVEGIAPEELDLFFSVILKMIENLE